MLAILTGNYVAGFRAYLLPADTKMEDAVGWIGRVPESRLIEVKDHVALFDEYGDKSHVIELAAKNESGAVNEPSGPVDDGADGAPVGGGEGADDGAPGQGGEPAGGVEGAGGSEDSPAQPADQP